MGMTEQSNSARLVKKVVVGFDVNILPLSLIRSFARLRGRLARAGFKIEVVLRPISRLPLDTDILFVPAELMEVARQAAPETLYVLAIHQSAYNELVKQLEEGGEIYALRAEDSADQSGSRGGTIVRYRGYTRIS